MNSVALDLSPLGPLTDEKLFALSRINPDTKLERTHEGVLMIMAPTGSWTGYRNIRIGSYLFMWNEQAKTGVVFDSSTGFTLPDGAMLSPDAAWIAKERWESLTDEEKETFAPLCPDFVVELMSKSDRLQPTQKKMQIWMANGCRLGWLIDQAHQKLYIYRADGSMSVLESFDERASGEDVLPGFELNLAELK